MQGLPHQARPARGLPTVRGDTHPRKATAVLMCLWSGAEALRPLP